MVRFAPLLLVAAPAVAFQVPQNRARTFSPKEAVAFGSDTFAAPGTDEDSGAMIDLTGVSFSVSCSFVVIYIEICRLLE